MMMKLWTWLRRREWQNGDDPQSVVDAYVDGELDGLDGEPRPELEEDIHRTRALKLMISALPDEPAPRSFAITPDMVQAPRRAPAPAPLLRLSQAAAGIGMVGLLIVGMTAVDLSSGGGDSDDFAAAPMSQQAEIRATSGSEGGAGGASGGSEDAAAGSPTVASAAPAPNGTADSSSDDGDSAPPVSPAEEDETFGSGGPDSDGQRNSGEIGEPEFGYDTLEATSAEPADDGTDWRLPAAGVLAVVAMAGVAGWVFARKRQV